LNELDVAANIRMFKESARVNPFLTAGIGGSLYGSEFGAFAPLGTGLQFNIGDGRTFATAQAQFRLAITDNTTDHLYYSLGLHQNFGRKEVAAPAPPVPAMAPVDTDGDGILDIEDLCPTVAGKAEFKGCPDTDNDGIQDADDKCPQQAGVAKYQGCPVPDTDGDGINDENDKCPQQPGVAQYQGCPIPDRDGDGINDDVDKCPDIKGVAAKQGCPDFMEIYKFDHRYVQFITGSAKLTKTATSELDKLVRALNDYPTIKVNVDGHTDNTGKAEFNMKLSHARAKSVVDYLVKKGISADRLIANGFGQEKPIADNATKEGRSINRRVEFSNHALSN
jgi:outer membrane protein OmpA-like peptidoglycan-associated protein